MQIVFLHVRQFFLNFLQLCAESLKGKDFIVLENMNFCFSTTVPFSFQRIEQKKSANRAFRNNQFCQVSCKEANTKQKNDISFQLKKEVKRILEIDSSCFRQQNKLAKMSLKNNSKLSSTLYRIALKKM